jgi:hypothetical protein
MQNTSNSKDICSKSSCRDNGTGHADLTMLRSIHLHGSTNPPHKTEDDKINPANDTILAMAIHDMNRWHHHDQIPNNGTDISGRHLG